MNSIWQIEWDARAAKELKKLDRQAQRDVVRYLKERIASDQDPRRLGKQLGGDKLGLWRYRIAAYRIICHIEDSRLTVLVLRVAHRSTVYE